MIGLILHEKYDILTGEQHERFSLQNTDSLIWESGYRSSFRTSCKIVPHTHIENHSALLSMIRDFLEITSI